MGRRRRVTIPAGGFRHIAVLRLSSLGDIVLTLPVVHALKRSFPAARISYWVKEEFVDLLRFDETIAHVRALERDARRLEDLVSMSAELEEADLIVDLHGNLRTRVLTFRQESPVLRSPSYRLARSARVHARWTRWRPPPPVLARHAMAVAPLGVTPGGRPQVAAGADAEAWAADWIAARPALPERVALVPGAAHLTKRWPESHWLELHDRLRAAGHQLVYFGLQTDRNRVPSLAEKVASDPGAAWCEEGLARVAALLSHCPVAVAGDTGLMHLAAARGTRVVALFGSTAPELGFAPAGEDHAVLCRHERCQPCTLHGRAACPRRHFRCMVELRPDHVEAEVGRLLAARGVRRS